MKQKPIPILFKILQSKENGEELINYHKSNNQNLIKIQNI